MFAILATEGTPAMTDRRELAALLALTEAARDAGMFWYEVADLVERASTASGLASGTVTFAEERDGYLATRLAERVTTEMVERWRGRLDRLLDRGNTSVVTVLDDEYPTNLRRIYNRPPFLFVRGTLDPADERSVAVVGTRRATPAGRAQAERLAGELAQRGVTVVSGLAAGIDTTAHTAALDAGGRTVAVMGTGIDRVYPAENRDLAMRIPGHGAIVSQFWPGSPPRAENFPLRNVVSSGIAVGTVVVEANGKSGARMQARLALDHGKRLFLVEPLVLHEEWARTFARRPGATVVRSVDDVLDALENEQEAERAAQLSLL